MTLNDQHYFLMDYFKVMKFIQPLVQKDLKINCKIEIRMCATLKLTEFAHQTNNPIKILA